MAEVIKGQEVARQPVKSGLGDSTLYSTKDRHGISNISSYDSGVRRGCPFLDGNAERQEVAGESLNNKREVRGV